jgi:hypothetical protein
MTVAELIEELKKYPNYYPVRFVGLDIHKVYESISEDEDDWNLGQWECILHSDDYGRFINEVIRRAQNGHYRRRD